MESRGLAKLRSQTCAWAQLLLLGITAVWTGLLAASCRSTDDTQSVATAYLASSNGASLRWPSQQINVCWERTPAYNQEIANYLRDGVVAQFKRAGITLVGWNICGAVDRGIHLAINNSEWPRVVRFGRNLDGVRNGVFLLSAPRTDLFGTSFCKSQESSQRCLRAVAIHEFGHALGLLHESNRRDTGCGNRDQTNGRGEPGGIAIGQYDPYSIMNGCYIDTVLGQAEFKDPELSPTDVSVLNDWYNGASYGSLQQKYAAYKGAPVGNQNDPTKKANALPQQTGFIPDPWVDPYSNARYPYCTAAAQVNVGNPSWGLENNAACKMRQ